MSQDKNSLPRAAGKLGDVGESAASCLTFETRPATPESVKRFRKSYFSEPGSRIAHPGLINDLKQINPLTKFGVVTTGSQHVGDVLSTAPSTEFQRISLQKSEAVYSSHKREPLGKSLVRGHKLPAHMQNSDFVFGISGTFGESAKELLYPSTCFNTAQDEQLYKKSHGSSAPGEQKNREYQWERANIDPARHRFGVKAIATGLDGQGAALCLNPESGESGEKPVITKKQVEDMRNTLDQLGRPRHLGSTASDLPTDHVFGAVFKKGNESAWECIQGNYSLDEQQPDADLGRPVNIGWKNQTSEIRPCGVPTIRSDISIPARRSIADSQNYGDDSTAKQLLYPEEFASSGIKDDEFMLPQHENQLRELFERIGQSFEQSVWQLIWKDATRRASTGNGNASILDVRNAINNYLEAHENGANAMEKWKQMLEAL